MSSTTIFYPNTLLISGIPSQVSRAKLMQVFGGKRKYYITEMTFTNKSGEPKKAFITYEEPAGVEFALEIGGSSPFDHYNELPVPVVVQRINGEIIAEYAHNLYGSFSRGDILLELSSVLQSVLGELQLERAEHIIQYNSLRDSVKRAETSKEQAQEVLRDSAENAKAYKTEKEATEKDLITKLSKASTRLERFQAKIVRLQGRLEEMEAETKKLSPTSSESQPQATTSHHSEPKAKDPEHQELLGKGPSRPDASQELAGSTDINSQLSTLKHQRSESPAGEPEVKRQRIDDTKRAETHRTDPVEKSVLERQALLEESLMEEKLCRKEAEDSLEKAKAKLDQVVIMDTLLKAFLILEHHTREVVEMELVSSRTST